MCGDTQPLTFFFYLSVPAGPTSQPNVDHIDEESVTLSWTKPKDDGGGKIQGYIVEKKPKDGDWEEVSPIPVKDTQAKVTNVKEGEECQFRVKAVNAAGPGAPSMPTSLIK